MTVNSALTRNLDPFEFFARVWVTIEGHSDVHTGLAFSEQIKNTCGEVALGGAANAA